MAIQNGKAIIAEARRQTVIQMKMAGETEQAIAAADKAWRVRKEDIVAWLRERALHMAQPALGNAADELEAQESQGVKRLRNRNAPSVR